jgi:cell division protein FtsL
LAPLDAREIELNAKQRELKEFERQQRLLDKATDKGRP